MVIFVFVENLRVRERPVGEGAFRHLQCETVVAFKNAVRDRFNPRHEGNRSEEHVIHGTDGAQQTDYLLKLLGHDEGVAMFERHRRGLLVGIPYHLPCPHRVRFTRLSIETLRACILTGGRGRKAPLLELVSVTATPHYLGFDDIGVYVEYLSRYRFHYLLDDHNPAGLMRLGSLSPSKLLALGKIVVECQGSGVYRVLDGVHRLAALARHGVDSVPCVEFSWRP